MGKIIAWLAKDLIAAIVTLFGTWKLFLGTTLVAICFVFMYNFWVDICEEAFTFITTQVQNVSVPGQSVNTYEFAGLAAYLAGKLKISECISFIVSVVLLKWTVRKIPFFKW